jgi:F0F1-type ATP synthase membrane subunit b/b'
MDKELERIIETFQNELTQTIRWAGERLQVNVEATAVLFRACERKTRELEAGIQKNKFELEMTRRLLAEHMKLEH